MQEQTQITWEDLYEIDLMKLSESEIRELIDNTATLDIWSGLAIEKLFYSQALTAGALKFMTKAQQAKLYNRVNLQSNVRQVIAEHTDSGHFKMMSSDIQGGLSEVYDAEYNEDCKFNVDEQMDLILTWIDSEDADRWGQGR